MHLIFQQVRGGPDPASTRTSEIRAAVVRHSPASSIPLYGCLGDLITDGRLQRITTERDALIIIKDAEAPLWKL
jgi:hypothetical protein